MHFFIFYLSVGKVRFHHPNKENVPLFNIPAVLSLQEIEKEFKQFAGGIMASGLYIPNVCGAVAKH